MVTYVLDENQWQTRTLSWHFATASSNTYSLDYTNYITPGAFQDAVRAAFAAWASIANINVKEVSGSDNSANITVGYQNLQSQGIIGLTAGTGDQQSDGSFKLRQGVSISFQDPNTNNVYTGRITYYKAALHEVGHALGLDHSTDEYSAMYAYLNGPGNNLNLTDAAGIQAIYGAKDYDITLTDYTTGDTASLKADTFTGPSGIPVDGQFIIGDTAIISTSDIISDNLFIKNTKPEFIHTGTGNDNINSSGSYGENILDGGTGSNWLQGATVFGSQNDFYVDERTQGSYPTWTTVIGGHSGDNVLIWGIQSNNWPSMRFYDNSGAAGYTGLTIAFDHDGHTDTFTMSGYSVADLSNGRLSTSFGHTADTNGLTGSDYMNIRVT